MIKRKSLWSRRVCRLRRFADSRFRTVVWSFWRLSRHDWHCGLSDFFPAWTSVDPPRALSKLAISDGDKSQYFGRPWCQIFCLDFICVSTTCPMVSRQFFTNKNVYSTYVRLSKWTNDDRNEKHANRILLWQPSSANHTSCHEGCHEVLNPPHESWYRA